MKVLSIDLASRRYKDFGIALLEVDSQTPSFPEPVDLGWEGEPEAESCAAALNAYCAANDVQVLLLDGPHAWRHPQSPIEHMRLAERVLNTPGKTGVPGQAKPKNYLRYIQFSIDLFHALHFDYKWSLIEQGWHRKRRKHRLVVESYPSAAWELLGLDRLPGKSRAKRADLNRFAKNLSQVTAYHLPKGLNHDQLQAAVVLPAGEAIAHRDPDGVILVGYEPLLDKKGNLLEGWIVEPRLS
ncbi:MAG: hypothetical protein PVF85_10440 [Anaerolineales bacterium]|jgi:hypothetical protein